MGHNELLPKADRDSCRAACGVACRAGSSQEGLIHGQERSAHGLLDAEPRDLGPSAGVPFSDM